MSTPWGQPPAPRPTRPWYKKKRFAVPIGTFVGLGIWGSFIDEPVTPAAQKPLTQVVDTTTDPLPAATTKTDVAAAEASAAAKAEAAAEAKRKARAKAKALAAKRTKALAAKKAAKERAAAERRAATKPEPPATVTPGAFCADSEAGDIGVSSAGNSYRCSLYPSGRYRWKRI